MAKKKRTRKRKHGLSGGLARRVKHSRGRRRGTRKRGFLSELSSGQNIMTYAKEGFSAGLGGFLAGEMEPMVASYSPFQQALAYGGVSYLAYSAGYKNMSMGVAGAYGLKMSRKRRGLADDDELQETDYTDQDALNDMCDALDENGTPMYLADDGEYYYAHEMQDDGELEDDDDGMNDDDDLQENYALSGGRAPQLLADNYALSNAPHLLAERLYPSYVNTSNY